LKNEGKGSGYMIFDVIYILAILILGAYGLFIKKDIFIGLFALAIIIVFEAKKYFKNKER
jgi:hypothetical protein